MEEKAKLLVKARRSIEAAKYLMAGGYAGSAASQAYYSMLYNAYALLVTEGISLSEEAKAIATFGEVVCAGKASIEFHAFLIDAYALRIAADEKRADILREEAQEQIAHAEQFLELAERLIGPIPTED